MFTLLHYHFIVRGLEAGLIIAVIAPLIGIFLVLRRYSLIADTLSHVSLAGVAIGLLLKINPIFTAIATTVVTSVFIEKLRMSKRVYGESALALFLSGSLALAIVLLSVGHGFTVDIFNFLFGSILTVSQSDVITILFFSIIVFLVITLLFKELIFISFDEEAARVSGIPTNRINMVLIALCALTISLSTPIIGILLISALMIIPVVTAIQLRKNFIQTILWSEFFSVISVIGGIYVAFTLNIAAGGTIVLCTLLFFTLTYLYTHAIK